MRCSAETWGMVFCFVLITGACSLMACVKRDFQPTTTTRIRVAKENFGGILVGN